MAILKYRKDTDNPTDLLANKFVVVTGGWDFITILASEEDFLSDVETAAAKTGKTVFHLETQSTPRTTAALGVSVVPALLFFEDGKLSGSLVGVASVEQLTAFFKTGVSPL